jgi:hypothetical protein
MMGRFTNGMVLHGMPKEASRDLKDKKVRRGKLVRTVQTVLRVQA